MAVTLPAMYGKCTSSPFSRKNPCDAATHVGPWLAVTVVHATLSLVWDAAASAAAMAGVSAA